MLKKYSFGRIWILKLRKKNLNQLKKVVCSKLMGCVREDCPHYGIHNLIASCFTSCTMADDSMCEDNSVIRKEKLKKIDSNLPKN